mmetsp:Transcript_40484/g.89957  ORF Transcript_40484/g.89957 Transcript_40484/m.89957 type:complete len:269 (-) Transcript_40484:26-832(-)
MHTLSLINLISWPCYDVYSGFAVHNHKTANTKQLPYDPKHPISTHKPHHASAPASNELSPRSKISSTCFITASCPVSCVALRLRPRGCCAAAAMLDPPPPSLSFSLNASGGFLREAKAAARARVAAVQSSVKPIGARGLPSASLLLSNLNSTDCQELLGPPSPPPSPPSTLLSASDALWGLNCRPICPPAAQLSPAGALPVAVAVCPSSCSARCSFCRACISKVGGARKGLPPAIDSAEGPEEPASSAPSCLTSSSGLTSAVLAVRRV